MSLLRVLAMSLTVLKLVDVSSREVYAEKAPAGTTPPADGWPVGNETCGSSQSIVLSLLSFQIKGDNRLVRLGLAIRKKVYQ